MSNKKHIIITGVSRGIGFELVKLFADAGHKVLALSRNDKPVSQLEYPNVTSFSFDLNTDEDVNRVKSFVENEWKHVDVLINNAGRLLNKPFSETSRTEFEAVYKVNVFGLAELTRIIIPYMNKESHVVSVSSMGGVQGSVKFAGLSAYSSSKGAVITLTELLAEEYKETGPSFNVLALGAVQTEMLEEAFPGYKAPLSALEMATYIYEFSLSGHKYYNGKLLQVSNSTP
ncbi:SDR family NAD(P)-dependent oxidoreductase [Zhouia amylolytica]|uniref:Short-chain dehydrogenase/reductase SDR n=1 Tax=Zhouia amylolytica AD3 TaxID=1286632 RepID=W2USZ4_9FLAO|nr:SDR family oxidoreductase [Zhouia amylolytica]ETN96611.1 short-chain dehydrogenase/reductase SDR [Zhouia amylolytica AD3]